MSGFPCCSCGSSILGTILLLLTLSLRDFACTFSFLRSPGASNGAAGSMSSGLTDIAFFLLSFRFFRTTTTTITITSKTIAAPAIAMIICICFELLFSSTACAIAKLSGLKTYDDPLQLQSFSQKEHVFRVSCVPPLVKERSSHLLQIVAFASELYRLSAPHILQLLLPSSSWYQPFWQGLVLLVPLQADPGAQARHPERVNEFPPKVNDPGAQISHRIAAGDDAYFVSVPQGIHSVAAVSA